MHIREMTTAECRDLLAHNTLGHIACCRDGQPYVTPMTFASDGQAIYAFATAGMRIDWMRLNPLICLEVEDIESPRAWRTVIVFGQYVELPREPEFDAERGIAHRLLSRRASWWEPGAATEAGSDATQPWTAIPFRIAIDSMSGRHATAD